MQAEWLVLTLDEAGVSLIDCDHRTPPASEAGYPYIAIPQLRDGHVALDGVRRISRQHLAEWTKGSSLISVGSGTGGMRSSLPRGADRVAAPRRRRLAT